MTKMPSATTLLGLVLYVLAFPMTIMNERAAVVSYLQHGEGLNLVHEFNPDDLSSQKASTAASYHQKLLHITTTLFPDTPLTVRDPDFGITVEGNFVLERRVEMLQWLEDDNAENSIDLEGDVEGTTDLLPSSNRFSYSLEWSSDSISSMSYHDRETHSNPTFAIQSQTFTPPNGLNIVPHYDSGKNHPISTLQFRLASQDIRNFIKPKTLFYIHEDTIHMAGVDGSGTSILAGAGTRPKAAGKGLKKLRRSDFELHDGMIYTKTLPSVLSTTTTTTTTNSDSIVAPNNPGALRISYRVTSMATGRQQNHTTPLLQRIHFAQHVARMHGLAQDLFFDRPRRRARTSAHRQLELLPTIFSQQVRHFARRRTEWWHQMEQSGGVCTVRRNRTRTHLGFLLLLLLLLLLQPRNKSCQPNQQTTTNLGRSRRRVGPET